MSQPDSITIPEAGPKAPTLMAQAINAAILAILDQHAGATRPAYALGGMTWIKNDVTPWQVFTFDGANDVLIGTIDPAAHAFQVALRSLEPEVDLASAATVDLGAANSAVVRITGTTQISAFGAGKNLIRLLRFAGALTLKNGAALALPGAADIDTAAGDTATALSDGAGNWRLTGYQRADGSVVTNKALTASFDRLSSTRGALYFRGATGLQAIPPGTLGQALFAGANGDPAFQFPQPVLPLGAINGLTLSRASAVAIGIGAGGCSNEDGSSLVNLTLTAAITKTLSAWGVGSGNGGLDTGVVAASTWYHVHLITKSSDGSIDALLSLSPTAPTMPSGYMARRRLGSIKTDASSQVINFVQVGDDFFWFVPVIDTYGNSTAGSYNVALTVPLGVRVKAFVRGATRSAASNFVTINIYPLGIDVYNPMAAGAAAPVISMPNTGVALVAGLWNSSAAEVWTNTSRQVGVTVTSSSNTGSTAVQTDGWRDPRGKS